MNKSILEQFVGWPILWLANILILNPISLWLMSRNGKVGEWTTKALVLGILFPAIVLSLWLDDLSRFWSSNEE